MGVTRNAAGNQISWSKTHNRFGDRGIAVAGPRLWNSLPISLRQISSYGQFRRYLKKSFIWDLRNHSAV